MEAKRFLNFSSVDIRRHWLQINTHQILRSPFMVDLMAFELLNFTHAILSAHTSHFAIKWLDVVL